MQIHQSVAFVTGANRGFGLALAQELLARGARKVYAGVRNPDSVQIPGVIPVKLDVTRPEDIVAAAAACADTTILVNNAGIAPTIGFLDPDSIEATRQLFDTNFFGVIRMSQAFAPVLQKNGGGAIVNVLSVASWISSTFLGPYAASKAAAWSFTNGLRTSLAEQGTQVLGVHVGFMDTEMTRDLQFPKVDPRLVAKRVADGLEAGQKEVLADDITHQVKQGLSAEPGVYLSPILR